MCNGRAVIAGVFWTHTVWYILLLLSSIAAGIVTIKRSSNHRFTVVFSLAVLGFLYCIEAILMLVLDAYTYYPMITPHDLFFDSVIGNFFSQISITSTAVLFCVLDLKSAYMFVFAFVYYLIDVLFSRFGLYVHNWYRSVFTLIGFVPIFWLIKKWYLYLTDSGHGTARQKKRLYTATLFFAVHSAASNSLITTQKWTGVQVFHSGIFADMTKDHTATGMIYGPVLIVLFMLLRRWNLSLLVKAGMFAALFTCQYILYRFGILITPPWWFVFATVIDLLGFYFWIAFLQRKLEQSNLRNDP